MRRFVVVAPPITLQLLIALLFVASGCTSMREYVHNGFKVGPNYQRPAAPVADEWIDSKNARLSIAKGDYGAWWRVFNDPTLDRVVQLSYQQNITLREAGFRVAEAQALRQTVAGNIFPQTQQLFGDYTRNQRSTETALFPNIPPGSPFSNLAKTEFDNWRFGGSLAWELDFWGRYRRSIEAADARLDSSIEGFDDALVILVGEAASTYIELRTVERRLNVAKENAVLQTESARIAEARLKARAVDSELDTPQAKANLGNTLATVESFEVNRRQAQNRLSVLLGMPPQDLTAFLDGAKPIPQAPDIVSIGVPAELIWRRPDVRRAERLVAAQSAEIGVAQSELYPHISIVGTGAWEAEKLGDLFKGSAFGGTVGPAFRWNVLNYGRLLNNIRANDARFQQLVASYQSTVLQANEEAENAITAFIHNSEQIKIREQSVREAREAERVAQVKYRGGEIDFNRLFTVQQLLLAQEEALALSRGAASLNLVQLYRALGGGWEIRLDPATQPPMNPPLAAPERAAEVESLPAPIPQPIP
jgi:NodT family efflux transporter outer membrane factor (OMF) lipoprotein